MTNLIAAIGFAASVTGTPTGPKFVFWKLDNGLDHTDIVTDKRDGKGVPFAIHNLSTALKEPVLTA